MGKDVRQALAELVARRDPAVFQTVERFSREMESLTGSQSPEIKALAIGLQARLPWTLRKVSDYKSLEQIAYELELIHGLSRNLSWWTIETWAYALVINLPKNPQAAQAGLNKPPQQATTSPSATQATPAAGMDAPSSSAVSSSATGPKNVPHSSAEAAKTPTSAPATTVTQQPPVPPSQITAKTASTETANPANNNKEAASGLTSAKVTTNSESIPKSPLGIEFTSGGGEGLFRVARVWSNSDSMPNIGKMALAQLVKPENPVARPLPISAVPQIRSTTSNSANTSKIPLSATMSKTGVSSTAAADIAEQQNASSSGAPPISSYASNSHSSIVSPSTSSITSNYSSNKSKSSPTLTPSANSMISSNAVSGQRQLGSAAPIPTPQTPEEQYQLARDLLEGNGRPVNLAEGVRLLRLAALHDHVPAYYTLGMVCLRGYGQKEDPVEAEKWFRKSAEKGNVDAMVQLGKLYQSGRGVRVDFLEARRWFAAAAQKGHAEAAALLKKLP